MAERARRAYAQWQEADTRAREAENRLKAAWQAYDVGGEPPTEALMAEVSRLRAVANDRLTMAVVALGVAKAGIDGGGRN